MKTIKVDIFNPLSKEKTIQALWRDLKKMNKREKLLARQAEMKQRNLYGRRYYRYDGAKELPAHIISQLGENTLSLWRLRYAMETGSEKKEKEIINGTI